MDNREQFRMPFDFFKHLSTLNIAGILLMAGLVERVFSDPVKDGRIDIIFWCFVLSLIGSLIMMFFFMFSPYKNIPTQGVLVITIAFFVAIVGFFASLALAYDVISAQRATKQVVLKYEIQASAEADDTYIYTISNKSTLQDAIIRKIEFIISSPTEIAEIGRIDQPLVLGAIPDPSDDISGYFYSGYWRGNEYVFISDHGILVPKNNSTEIRLRIANKKYGNRWFKGQLILYYDGQCSPLKIEGVSVKASPDYDKSVYRRIHGHGESVNNDTNSINRLGWSGWL